MLKIGESDPFGKEVKSIDDYIREKIKSLHRDYGKIKIRYRLKSNEIEIQLEKDEEEIYDLTGRKVNMDRRGNRLIFSSSGMYFLLSRKVQRTLLRSPLRGPLDHLEPFWDRLADA